MLARPPSSLIPSRGTMAHRPGHELSCRLLAGPSPLSCRYPAGSAQSRGGFARPPLGCSDCQPKTGSAPDGWTAGRAWIAVREGHPIASPRAPTAPARSRLG